MVMYQWVPVCTMVTSALCAILDNTNVSGEDNKIIQSLHQPAWYWHFNKIITQSLFRLRARSGLPPVQYWLHRVWWSPTVCGDWSHGQTGVGDSFQDIPWCRLGSSHTRRGGPDQYNYFCWHKPHQGKETKLIKIVFFAFGIAYIFEEHIRLNYFIYDYVRFSSTYRLQSCCRINVFIDYLYQSYWSSWYLDWNVFSLPW